MESLPILPNSEKALLLKCSQLACRKAACNRTGQVAKEHAGERDTSGTGVYTATSMSHTYEARLQSNTHGTWVHQEQVCQQMPCLTVKNCHHRGAQWLKASNPSHCGWNTWPIAKRPKLISSSEYTPLPVLPSGFWRCGGGDGGRPAKQMHTLHCTTCM